MTGWRGRDGGGVVILVRISENVGMGREMGGVRFGMDVC